MKKIKSMLNSLLLSTIWRKRNKFYRKQFKKYLQDLGFDPESKIEGEDDYIHKWSEFGIKVEPYSYRLFSRYCGKSADIVPETIGRSFLEESLNPASYRGFYTDKNTYRMYLDKSHLPATLLSRIGGGAIEDGDGNVVNDIAIPDNINRVILKPSVDSSSGRGVECYSRIANGWLSKDGVKLDIDYLKKYGKNFILQEAVSQHPYISRFCATSVNTFRIAVYRSVSDESVNVVGALMRVGKDGQFVDNAHAGGRFVGIDSKTGKINQYLCDTYGNKYTEWNGIDYTSGNYVIPNWDKVIDFARYVGKSVPHMRLLALDLCLDKDGKPVLIEFNSSGFSFWLFMYSGKTPFGEFTDEIIEYAKQHKPYKIKSMICCH